MTKEIIKLDKLSKFYGKTPGIVEANLTVYQGEVFGFLGPNGAGKTTTIRLMLDLIRPSDGRIEILGMTLPQDSVKIRRKIGYLPGNFRAYPDLRAGDFIKYMLSLRGLESHWPGELLERFQLPERQLKQKIRELSHGNLQKLGIIQAFAPSPPLLILDEPTLGLDPVMQEALFELIRERQATGATVFFSSHHLNEVEKLCDRVGIVRSSRIVDVAEISRLKKKLQRRVIVEFANEVELPDWWEVKQVRQNGTHLELWVEGDLPAFLPKILSLKPVDIFLPEPNLEEVFLSYYNGEGD